MVMVFSSFYQRIPLAVLVGGDDMLLSCALPLSLETWRFASSAFSISGNGGPCGGGATISIFFGVKIKTSAIRKNARKVFLSIFI